VNGAPLLKVDDLHTRFHTRDGVIHAVNGVSFGLAPSETLGIVGESGCGKSVLSLSIMRLIPDPPGRIERGAVHLEGRNLLELSEQSMRRVRGNEMSMVFQEPMTSLNPALTVGFQIAEALRLHAQLPAREAERRAIEFLARVRIPDPERRAREYPHQLSGGMRQRVMIAMSLSCHPKVLIADEPTTALDVTIQAQILALMRRLRDEFAMAVIIITHDLGVVAEVAERVLVMYAGRKVEEAPVGELFRRPLHPYTRGLLASVPRLGASLQGRGRLREIPGQVPSLRHLPEGCPFVARCEFATARCREAMPPLETHAEVHHVACWEVERVRAASDG